MATGVGGEQLRQVNCLEQFRARCKALGVDANRLLNEAKRRSMQSPKLTLADALREVWREATAKPEDWRG